MRIQKTKMEVVSTCIQLIFIDEWSRTQRLKGFLSQSVGSTGNLEAISSRIVIVPYLGKGTSVYQIRAALLLLSAH